MTPLLRTGLLTAVCAAAVLVTASALRAADAGTPRPHIAAGAAATASVYHVWEVKRGSEYHRFDFGPGYGGGFVFEKMYTNLLGIQTALLADYSSIEMKLGGTLGSGPYLWVRAIKFTVNSWRLDLPFTLVLSFNTARLFSFNILAGIRFGILIDPRIRAVNFVMATNSLPGVPTLMQFTISATAGLGCRFHVSEHVDVFATVMGSLAATEFFRGGSDRSHLFSANLMTGVLYRTDLFPMTSQK